MPTQHTKPIHAMRIVATGESEAAVRARSRARMLPAALAPGLHPTKSHDLIFHGGRTIPNLSFFNFFLGGEDVWSTSDRDEIDSALEAAMSDRDLNNVIQQYFNGQITSHFLGSQVLVGPPPKEVSQGDVEDLTVRLYGAGNLNTADFGSTAFNFILPSKAILNDNPGVTSSLMAAQFASEKKSDSAIPAPDEGDSTTGLGGNHGSISFHRQTVYYAVGVYSENLPDGTKNGIPVFHEPWKNVVATFYHELNEARTDPDVEDANRTGELNLVGWTSRQGEECGDFPVFEANPLTQVFQEVPLTNGSGKVPVQFQYSNAVDGPEGPIPEPH
jgi:hypothetical protein